MPVILPELPSPTGVSATTHARRGLDRASGALESAAERVAAGTVVATSILGDPDALVSLSPEAVRMLDGIEGGLIEGKLAQHSYTANAAVVRAADEMAEETVRLGQRRA